MKGRRGKEEGGEGRGMKKGKEVGRRKGRKWGRHPHCVSGFSQLPVQWFMSLLHFLHFQPWHFKESPFLYACHQLYHCLSNPSIFNHYVAVLADRQTILPWTVPHNSFVQDFTVREIIQPPSFFMFYLFILIFTRLFLKWKYNFTNSPFPLIPSRPPMYHVPKFMASDLSL